ncbi:hypothetical protein LCGC14_3077530 [marine sediment metagenome]|uniref:Uncharacterized protein n=1 Tax=marine sediment metagenome TaxID=412755 RepID=A0A0F8YLT8_9ZZZZ
MWAGVCEALRQITKEAQRNDLLEGVQLDNIFEIATDALIGAEK